VTTADDAREAYLDELADAVRALPGREIRRVLAEADDHLRASASELEAAGVEPEAAAAQAIAQFGSAATAARHVRLQHPAGLGGLLTDAIRKLSIVGVAGLCAIGLSGWLSAGLGAIFGKAFIAGDGPDVTYTAERCRDFMSFHPEAATCAAAATAHHFDEIVGYRQDLGVLGVLGAIVLLILARRGVVGRWLRTGPLPGSTPPVVASVLFGAAATVLMGLGLMQIAFGITNGAGSMLADGLIATDAFALSAWWLVRSVRSVRFVQDASA
jgi:hypothetical protein